MFGWFRNLLTGETRRERIAAQRQRAALEMFQQRFADLRSRYDAAQLDYENRNHWANADHLSPRNATRAHVRRTLRARSRYEIGENNSFGKGIVLTLANDTIGTGPRLQIQTENPRFNETLEKRWREWSESVELTRKLQLTRYVKCVDGEAFIELVQNRRAAGLIALDIRVHEAEMIGSPLDGPMFEATNPRMLDGIEYDEQGMPTRYRRFRSHPGDAFLGARQKFDWVDAREMIHVFREDRPGQLRGIPELTPALPLFAMLRRHSLATLAAAETAASIAVLLQSELPPNNASSTQTEYQPEDLIPWDFRQMMVLPNGYSAEQMKPEHPATTHEMFTKAILNEIARCVNMPFNIAAANSSGYNYASGRLDHQVYFRSLDVERDFIRARILERLFLAWLAEAEARRLVPRFRGKLEEIPHSWLWPAHPHADPVKEATAATMLWEKGLLTDAEYWASRGVDPEEQYTKLARQRASREDSGAPQPSGATPATAGNDTGDTGEEVNEEETEQAAA